MIEHGNDAVRKRAREREEEKGRGALYTVARSAHKYTISLLASFLL